MPAPSPEELGLAGVDSLDDRTESLATSGWSKPTEWAQAPEGTGEAVEGAGWKAGANDAALWDDPLVSASGAVGVSAVLPTLSDVVVLNLGANDEHEGLQLEAIPGKGGTFLYLLRDYSVGETELLGEIELPEGKDSLALTYDPETGEATIWAGIDGGEWEELGTATEVAALDGDKAGISRLPPDGSEAGEELLIDFAASNEPPVNTTLPAVTGTAQVGETLSCSEGEWDNEPTSFAYQWQRSATGEGGWADILGAATSTYKLVVADEGEFIRCVVTATNAGGKTAAASASTEEVLPGVSVEVFGETLEFTTLEAPKARRRNKPPLALDLEVETPDGTFRLPSDSRKARNRPRGLSFSTQRGDGFATGSAQLSREIFRDYPDVSLMDTWRMVSKQDEVAYEGRLHSNPRTNDPQEQIDIALVGWMTYLKSRKIGTLIIDRRLGGWGEPSTQRKADLLTAQPAHRFGVNVTTGLRDAGQAAPGVIMEFQRKGPRIERGEAWLYAGGEKIRRLRFDLEQLSNLAPFETFDTFGRLSTDDLGTEQTLTADLSLTDTANVSLEAEELEPLYAALSTAYTGAEGDMEITLAFLSPRVYGDHDLTPVGESPEEGFELTDIVNHILATHYPKVKLAGQNYTFPVQQATWHDNRAYGYDAIRQLNDFVLGETNMWEDRTLYHEPADLTRYDWQIRTDDPGVTVLFQGDSIESFANGVEVTYTDFNGVKRTLLPSDHAELRDDSESNPANRHGEKLWVPIEPTIPSTEAEALQYGRTYLAELNRPKRPGTYQIAGGWVRDHAGHWRPGWAVRNGQTLIITDHFDDTPRLIVATDWNDDDKLLRITVDAPDKLLDAIVARQENARQARNLA